jgi:hypothetical protein
MDLTGITGNQSLSYLIKIQSEHSQFIIPNFILFEPHIVTLSMLLGLVFLDEFFNYLFWNDIRPLRNSLREWIKKKLKG